MSKVNDFIAALSKLGDGRYSYYNAATGRGIGCSTYVRYALGEANIITSAEANNEQSLWAGQRYRTVLKDTSRFIELPPSTTPIKGDIMWYHGAHVSVCAGGSDIYEASPESTHGICSNGKTGVGLWKNHTYNCAGIPLTCIYRIIDSDKKFSQATIEAYISKALEIANDDTHGYSNIVDNNLGRPDYDCGSFVSAALRSVGLIGSGIIFEPNSPTGTYGYDVILTNAGFVKNKFDYNTVKRGDILIRDGAHTEIALGKNSNGANQQVGAHYNYDGVPGDGRGNEISVVALSTNWTYMYRLPVDGTPTQSPAPSYPVLREGAKGDSVKQLQTLLNNAIGAGLAIDGSFGPATLEAVKKYQKLRNLAVDGSVGPATWASLLAEKEPIIEKPVKEVTPKELFEIAVMVIDGKYGSGTSRKEKLTAEYGEAAASKIQKLINEAYK